LLEFFVSAHLIVIAISEESDSVSASYDTNVLWWASGVTVQLNGRR